MLLICYTLLQSIIFRVYWTKENIWALSFKLAWHLFVKDLCETVLLWLQLIGIMLRELQCSWDPGNPEPLPYIPKKKRQKSVYNVIMNCRPVKAVVRIVTYIANETTLGSVYWLGNNPPLGPKGDQVQEKEMSTKPHLFPSAQTMQTPPDEQNIN
jgi:hypothetical protein